ncbi:MAG TPA: GGDEF domain-containing protein [Candidatus Competibacteraceae bacterium]|nr:GGDEF domain-containing protein [Candidatus Competibacteraceae bacterium]MCP5134377.1 GGDEF domain-containing protein [Gammaproteobacteria bacterium]HPF57842.1 GGDEF domain-containing protein [Candidatus Competibacteraceae bacterium]HRY17412.1 GGDEF domain-containing protein [Candidatus Competibacteraceae bacterium]
MNLPDHERLLESIARLTEKRDRESLELCLIQTMFELLPTEEISLYQVEGHQFGLLVRVNPEGCWSMNEESQYADYPMPPINDALFTDCLCRRQMLVEPVSARTQRYAFPILYQNQGIGILCLESTRDLSEDRRLIAGFMRIYQNYLALIHENAHDRLTGLLNRKTFDERLINILLSYRRTDPMLGVLRANERRQHDDGNSYWLAVLDIDHFKRINDTFGHLYGDEVLLLMANLMRQSFRRNDLLFRYGGEEFVIVLKTETKSNTLSILERFRHTVELYNFPQVGQVTISIGVSQINASEMPTMIIERADRALYYAKANGRNQIHCYENLTADGTLFLQYDQPSDDIELF